VYTTGSLYTQGFVQAVMLAGTTNEVYKYEHR
jgi:hypothetical protein